MNADEALMEAWNLGMDEADWTDAVMERAEELMPTLLAAGYVVAESNKWWFTPEGVARAKELEQQSGD